MVALARRSVLALGLTTGLAGAGVLAAQGCTARGAGPAPTPTAPPPPDPLLAELADEVRLLAAYDATAARHPALRVRLATPRADHTRHAEALARTLDAAGSGAPTPSASPTGGATVRVPGTPAGALAALRASERAAAAARSAAALTAPGARAALLASVAASEASHLVVLA